MDAQEPHLRTRLSFMGITDQEFILAERLAFGAEERETAPRRAKDGIARTVRLAVAQGA